MLARGFGGAERSFVDMSEALVSKGHDVIAVCEARGKARSLLQGPKNYPITVRAHWDPFASVALTKIIQTEKPDLVHAHLARAAKIAGKAANKLGIPSLVKTHNYVDLKYYQNIDCLVPTTLDQEKYLVDSGIPAENISRIPNFTSLSLARSPKRIAPGEDIHLVAIGRLVAKKGFDKLLHALSNLSVSSTENMSENIRAAQTVKLTIVGDGPERENLTALAKTLKIDNRIFFSGWLDNVAGVLDAADIFVLPSTDEPFGIVCLEAMARAIPIVATKTQGPREILDDKTAVLVEPGDVEALEKGIAKAISNPQHTYKRAELALVRCAENFTRDVVVERYLALYRRLI
jgi:glycosyltransferase involved in cell wall biosynthesis